MPASSGSYRGAGTDVILTQPSDYGTVKMDNYELNYISAHLKKFLFTLKRSIFPLGGTSHSFFFFLLL